MQRTGAFRHVAKRVRNPDTTLRRAQNSLRAELKSQPGHRHQALSHCRSKRDRVPFGAGHSELAFPSDWIVLQAATSVAPAAYKPSNFNDRIWKTTHAMNPLLTPVNEPLVGMPDAPAGLKFDESLLETPVTQITKLSNGVQVGRFPRRRIQTFPSPSHTLSACSRRWPQVVGVESLAWGSEPPYTRRRF